MVVPLRQRISEWGHWHFTSGKLLNERETFFKRYLYRNYHIFAAITHRFHRRITPSRLDRARRHPGGGDAGGGYQRLRLLQDFRAAGVRAASSAPPARLLAGPNYPCNDCCQSSERRANGCVTGLWRETIPSGPENALRLIEELPDPRPSFHEFASIPEPGEESRNWLDRTYGYYRWRWLMGRNRNAHIEEQPLPDLPGGAECSIEAELLPLRRGLLRLTGTTVACPDPFGLFRSLRKIPGQQSVLILPKRYPVPKFDLPGSMKYQLGGVSHGLVGR